MRGATLRYLVGGAGPPLVLVHGLAGAASNWVELAPLLARRHRVLIPELPGHGGSDPLPAAPSLDPFADRVIEVARLEGMLPAALAGHSLGGTVALRAAARHPRDVTAVVLLAGAGITSAGRSIENALTLAVLGAGKAIAPLRGLIARRPWTRRAVFGYWQVADPPALSAVATEGFLAGPGLHLDVGPGRLRASGRRRAARPRSRALSVPVRVGRGRPPRPAQRRVRLRAPARCAAARDRRLRSPADRRAPGRLRRRDRDLSEELLTYHSG